MALSSYHDRTVLVTGASSGIGAAMARRLAADGARLLLVARSEDALDQLAEAFRGGGGEAHVYAHDLGTPGAGAALFDRIQADGHAVDVLINNAGFGKMGAFDLTTYEGMITLNVTNLVALTRRFLPAMQARGQGGVLNVASTAGYQPLPYMAVYAATKAFVLSFSQGLSGELAGSGVHISCLCPGATRTDFQETAAMDGHMLFLKQAETPETVARRGLEGLLNNNRVVISGAMNTVGAMVAKVLPTGLSLAVGKRLFGPDQ